MSDFSAELCSMTGHIWTLVSKGTYTPITPNEFGQNFLGLVIKSAIEKSRTETFIENFLIVIWRNGDLTFQTIWELRGLRQDLLKSLWELWKTSRQDIAGVQLPSHLPFLVYLAGGNGLLNSYRLPGYSLRHLVAAAISSGGPEMILHFEKLLRSCLKAPLPTG